MYENFRRKGGGGRGGGVQVVILNPFKTWNYYFKAAESKQKFQYEYIIL